MAVKEGAASLRSAPVCVCLFVCEREREQRGLFIVPGTKV